MRKSYAVLICTVLILLASIVPSFAGGVIESTDIGLVYEYVDEKQSEIIIMCYRGIKTKIKIPSMIGKATVKYINEAAFRGNISLQSVVIPNSVIEIGEEAFAGCDNLRSVTLPDSLVKLPAGVFSGCRVLDGIELPKTLEIIDDRAFEGCILLSELIIPASVNEIGYDVFMTCENLLLDCSENDLAQKYADDNQLVTDYLLSGAYLRNRIITYTAIFTCVALAAYVVYRIVKRHRAKIVQR